MPFQLKTLGDYLSFSLPKLAMTFMAFCVIQANTCQAQVFIGQGEDLGAKMQQELDEQKSIAERRMRLVVNEMERTCGLSEKQVNQLRVAIKGTVAKFLNAKAEERIKQWQALGMPVPEEDDDVEAPAAPESEDDPEPVANNRIMIGAFGQSYDSYPRVDEFIIWKNTVDKVLTAEQQVRYAEVVEERAVASRRSAVERFIANADRRLVLSPKQRERLFELVDDQFGEKLVRSETRGMDMMEVNMFMGLGDRHNVKMPIEREHVAEILDEDQMEEWKHCFELQLNQLPDH